MCVCERENDRARAIERARKSKSLGTGELCRGKGRQIFQWKAKHTKRQRKGERESQTVTEQESPLPGAPPH